VDIDKMTNLLIEQRGYQYLFGDDYAALGSRLHGDSQDVLFLKEMYNDLHEWGDRGMAFSKALEIWVSTSA
jgi:hypothetical protein